MTSAMSIGVFGTGPVGQSIASKLASQGHAVFIGTRDPAVTLARVDPDSFGNPPFRVWYEKHPKIEFGTVARAATRSALLVNATRGIDSVSLLRAAGEGNFAGKILIDIANPVDLASGMPPSLSVCNTDSLGEQIQRAFPGAKVVKTLNTMNARLQVEPDRLAGADHTVFVSGNDASAKQTVTELLRSFGWKDIIDLGDITTARGTEMMLALVVRATIATGLPIFSFKLVR